MSAVSVPRWLPALVGAAGLAASLWLPEAPAAQGAPHEPAYAPDRVIVQFKAGIGEALRWDALQRVGARAHAVLGPGDIVKALAATDPRAVAAAARLELVKTNRPVLEAVRILSRHPAVAFAEPDWILTHQDVSDDTY